MAPAYFLLCCLSFCHPILGIPLQYTLYLTYTRLRLWQVGWQLPSLPHPVGRALTAGWLPQNSWSELPLGQALGTLHDSVCLKSCLVGLLRKDCRHLVFFRTVGPDTALTSQAAILIMPMDLRGVYKHSFHPHPPNIIPTSLSLRLKIYYQRFTPL